MRPWDTGTLHAALQQTVYTGKRNTSVALERSGEVLCLSHAFLSLALYILLLFT